jgi:hypothetical protein
MTSHHKGAQLKIPTNSQIDVLRAARTREAGGNWAIKRSDGLDCIEHLAHRGLLPDRLGQENSQHVIKVKVA